MQPSWSCPTATTLLKANYTSSTGLGVRDQLKPLQALDPVLVIKLDCIAFADLV